MTEWPERWNVGNTEDEVDKVRSQWVEACKPLARRKDKETASVLEPVEMALTGA